MQFYFFELFMKASNNHIGMINHTIVCGYVFRLSLFITKSCPLKIVKKFCCHSKCFIKKNRKGWSSMLTQKTQFAYISHIRIALNFRCCFTVLKGQIRKHRNASRNLSRTKVTLKSKDKQGYKKIETCYEFHAYEAPLWGSLQQEGSKPII